jgi:hypothetical protein
MSSPPGLKEASGSSRLLVHRVVGEIVTVRTDPLPAVDSNGRGRSCPRHPRPRPERLLMGAYASAGRRGAALRQFLECRRALVEQLGIEPAAETLALQRRILAGA